MTEQEVSAWLLAHPEFFAGQPELLARISVPHPDTGQAISLTERQLQVLRDKLQMLQEKMAELVRFGEENDVIGERVHRFSLSLLEANSIEAVCRAIDTHLVDPSWKDSIYFEPGGERWYYYDTRISKLCVLRTWW